MALKSRISLSAAIDEAVKAREQGKEKVILFNYSGHGLMDLNGYGAYLAGKLTDYEMPDDVLNKSLSITFCANPLARSYLPKTV